MNKFSISFLLSTSLLFTACGGGGSGGSSSPSPTPIEGVIVQYSNDVDLNTFPAYLNTAQTIGYAKIIEVKYQGSSSGINILSIDDAGNNNEKMKRVAGIVSSLLANLATSTNPNVVGNDKKDIINTLINRNATIFLNETEADAEDMSLNLYTKTAIDLGVLNTVINDAGLTADFAAIDKSSYVDVVAHIKTLGGTKPDDYMDELNSSIQSNSNTPKWVVNSQDIYLDEITIDGDTNYLNFFNNGAAGRDAVFEEIMHIIQAQGIAPTTKTKNLQARIDAHAKNIYDNSLAIWQPSAATWAEWAGDDTNSAVIGTTYSHEYYAAALEGFYGLWAYKATGLDDYSSISREEQAIKDPSGLSMIKEFIPNYHQYTARINSDDVKTYYDGLGKTPIFKMNESADADEKYTLKSKYFLNIKLINNAIIDIEGNDQNNIIEGNLSNNEIDGKDGSDIYKVDGNFADYVITDLTTHYTITGANIGTDTLRNIETIKFNDRNYSLN